MTAQITQDQQYIAFVRNHSTAVLTAASAGVDANGDWNAMYGGASRLQSESFQGGDEGLDKDDINNAKSVIYALNTWLDEAGQNRRAYLMAVCFQPGV